MNVEADVEKRLQALVAKDRIRIKEFFIDFDKLRKGFVGEAGVSDFPEFPGPKTGHPPSRKETCFILRPMFQLQGDANM